MNLFNMIKNEKEYWLVDQRKASFSKTEYQSCLTKILNDWHMQEVGYLSLLMDETYETFLFQKGFHKVSSIVEYTRKLVDLPVLDDQFAWHNLSEKWLIEREYGELYQLCKKGSANKSEKQTASQFIQSLKRELGPKWRQHCYYFTKDQEIIGMAIPHIEMGTAEEGRLFYFGIVPYLRGQGFGTKIHQITLSLLKQGQATYYVGSTDASNLHMIQIFIQNDCEIRDQKGMYKILK